MNQRVLKDDYLGLVPVFTSSAGSCLTAANWQEAGVKAAAFHLADLLMRPGFEFLNTLPDLATYVGWHEKLVLNACLPMSSNGFYELRSRYDGRRIHHTMSDILSLIIKLQPDSVILPEGMWQHHGTSLSEAIFPFIPFNDYRDDVSLDRPHGMYLSYDKKVSSATALFELLTRYKRMPCYIAGDLGLPMMLDLLKHGAQLVESDIPAANACLSHVYSRHGDISLQSMEFAQQFETIDEECKCTVCSQKFTKAYLHHLLGQTPLLCQRYLVQHNVHYCRAAMNNY